MFVDQNGYQHRLPVVGPVEYLQYLMKTEKDKRVVVRANVRDYDFLSFLLEIGYGPHPNDYREYAVDEDGCWIIGYDLTPYQYLALLVLSEIRKTQGNNYQLEIVSCVDL